MADYVCANRCHGNVLATHGKLRLPNRQIVAIVSEINQRKSKSAPYPTFGKWPIEIYRDGHIGTTFEDVKQQPARNGNDESLHKTCKKLGDLQDGCFANFVTVYGYLGDF